MFPYVAVSYVWSDRTYGIIQTNSGHTVCIRMCRIHMQPYSYGWACLTHECAHSPCASLCNYSFLVRLHIPSKSPTCTWKNYASITLSGPMQVILPACTRYHRSAHGQRSWLTTFFTYTRFMWGPSPGPMKRPITPRADGGA